MQSASHLETESSILFVLTLLALAVRIVVIAACAARGQLRRYSFFCLLVFYGFTVSTISLFLNTSQAYTFWINTRWLEAALNAAAAIEAFWGLARHFRSIRWFGWMLISIIVAVSAGAAGILGILRANWSGVLRGGLLVGQFVNVSLLLTALLSVAFFRQFRKIPVRPNAILYLRVLGLLFGISSFGFFITQMTRGQLAFLPGLLFRLGPVAAYLWWIIGMKRDGEALPFEPPVISDEDYEAAEAAHKRSVDQLKQSGSEALRKTLRS